MPNVSNTCKIMKTQHPKTCYILALVIWFFLGGCTYTVNTTLDRPDTNPGDYKCISLVPINFVTGPPPGGGTSPTHVERCSLRAAVMEANFNGAMDTIVVPSGLYTLDLAPAAGGGRLKLQKMWRFLVPMQPPLSSTWEAQCSTSLMGMFPSGASQCKEAIHKAVGVS